jgi:hypothetical protein
MPILDNPPSHTTAMRTRLGATRATPTQADPIIPAHRIHAEDIPVAAATDSGAENGAGVCRDVCYFNLA